MTAAYSESVPFSELLRHPAKTTARLAHARAVRLRRREAVDLVLMSADRAQAEAEVIDLTARLLASVAHREPELIRDVLRTAVPWIRYLPAADSQTMAEEFVAAAEAAASIGNTAAVSQLLTEWRHTAEIYADPDLHRALTTPPLADFGLVPRPVEQ